jgi:hypothetical protein
MNSGGAADRSVPIPEGLVFVVRVFAHRAAAVPSELLTAAGIELVTGGESTLAQRKILTSVLASRAFLGEL